MNIKNGQLKILKTTWGTQQECYLNPKQLSEYYIVKEIKDFMATNPTEEEIEKFYVNKILPIDKRSIDEILDLF